MPLSRPQTVSVETTYWPSELGPYLWLEFDAGRAGHDLEVLRDGGFRSVRVHCAWDAFMPDHRQVSRRRLRDFESLLRAALAAEVSIVPVLFVQTIGDIVMLPQFLIEHSRRHGAIRVVCDGLIEPGTPRDIYDDPLAIEAAVLWMTTMLDGFANHPAIAAWDLGHDPATGVRPRRTSHFTAWVTEIAGLVRGRQDICRLTLGAGDVLTARAVRLAPLAPHLDRIDLAVMPQRLRFGRNWPEVDDLAFLIQLAQRLAGEVDLGMNVCVAAGDQALPAAVPRDPGVAITADAAAYGAAVVPVVAEAGAVSAGTWPSHSVTGRAAESAPFDRLTSLVHAGVVDAGGELTAWGKAMSKCAKGETAVSPMRLPWPDRLDDSDYYSNFIEASKELFTSWRSGRGGQPDIVI